MKALSDTLGPEGLVPSALVFGEFPSPYTGSETPKSRLSLEARARAANSARREMEQEMAKVRIKRDLHYPVRSAARFTLCEGDVVLVLRKRVLSSRIGEFLGPFKAESIDYAWKLVFIRD